jgi:hypothetical protein
MINTSENSNSNSETGANGPVSVTKLKEYGKKAYGPLVEVVSKYQDEIIPYISALAKGLQGGVDSLNKEDASAADKYVSQFFKDAADGLNSACEKLQAKDMNALSSFLTEQAESRPSIMFGTSYVAGLFFGRLGRHLARQKTTTNTETPSFEPPSFEESSEPTIQ